MGANHSRPVLIAPTLSISREPESLMKFTLFFRTNTSRSKELKSLSDPHTWTAHLDAVMYDALQQSVNCKDVTIELMKGGREGIVKWTSAECPLPRVEEALVNSVMNYVRGSECTKLSKTVLPHSLWSEPV